MSKPLQRILYCRLIRYSAAVYTIIESIKKNYNEFKKIYIYRLNNKHILI